jgi:hypothetical protein
MNVEIGTETPIFLFWEYLFRNFGILSLQCGHGVIDTGSNLVDCFIDIGKILVANTVDSGNKNVQLFSLILVKNLSPTQLILATKLFNCFIDTGQKLVAEHR